MKVMKPEKFTAHYPVHLMWSADFSKTQDAILFRDCKFLANPELVARFFADLQTEFDCCKEILLNAPNVAQEFQVFNQCFLTIVDKYTPIRHCQEMGATSRKWFTNRLKNLRNERKVAGQR